MGKQNGPRKLQDEIERNLKRTFEEVAQEEIPDRFKDLLAQLRAGEVKKDTDNGK